MRAAQSQLRAAQAELQRAVAVYRAADRESIAGGTRLLTARAEDAAKQATRRADAARDAYREAAYSYLGEIACHFDDWLEDQEHVVEGV